MVESTRQSAAELLASLDDRPPPLRWARLGTVTGPALVLGSAQDERVVVPGSVPAGVAVVRRRTGGGAVVVVPGHQVWIDFWLPAGDELHERDLDRSFAWLGQVFATALSALGVEAEVHTGPLLPRRWGRLVCFAGLGPGEVSVAGRKVVGLAQRRTRHGAWFQAMALLRWAPEEWCRWLVFPESGSCLALEDLAAAASGLELDGGELGRAVIDALP